MCDVALETHRAVKLIECRCGCREAGVGLSPQWVRASLAVASVLWNLVELVVQYFECSKCH